ncbi:extracellular solute-binding protein [Paenibacillus arenilitoris]|uniref:Extracellular solute-binding protein n=1 Tax=Paenibacillus arenilitoris TaxID=2772299 RepID=A0A927CHF0_9BACL|nr:extracellular solute-binding protein [Paenibacillus arenilitoris]MBD2867087.1 extracellular solute-binding protein [Paenibacillus arenilitoris]
MNKKWMTVLVTAMAGMMAVTACGGKGGNNGIDGDGPYPLSLVINQVGEIPDPNNPIEEKIREYTDTDLRIQWIPYSAYDEKINVMIASDELPKLMKLNYTPTTISSLEAGLFWDITSQLKDYPNLTAQPQPYYDNISVNGKVYGVPLFRDMGRAIVSFRKDWLDAAGLKEPVTLDDWYEIIRYSTEEDPDKNGKRDTYGMMLDKAYNQGTASTLTRLAVSQGAPNKWGIDEQGNFYPEFESEPFFDVLKLFRRLYEEKLINQDFAVVDSSELNKVYESGRANIRISGGNGQSLQTKLEKVVPDAVIDVAPLQGPDGIRVPGESGNTGFLAIPKSTVASEEELDRVLAFVDKLLEPEMVNLINKGVEGVHYKVEGDFTVTIDAEKDAQEVKPYRDSLPQRGELYNMEKKAKGTELFNKNKQIVYNNENFIVANPALTLNSATYNERGGELEQIITDAQTKFIMGQIDEAGWKAEVEKWRKSGGDQMAAEYKASYESVK